MMFGTGVPEEFNYKTDPQLRKMLVGDFHSLNIFFSFFCLFKNKFISNGLELEMKDEER